jgi:hypothetical protein
VNVAPGVSYESTFAAGVPGLVGTIALGLLDNQGGIVEALSTGGIIETPAGSGVYAATRTSPGGEGQYTLLWSLDGTTAPEQVSIDELVVSATTTSGGGGGGTDPGPPVPSGPTTAPTAADVRAHSLVNFDEFGYPEDTPDPLQYVVDQANAWLTIVTGRYYPPVTDPPTTTTGDRMLPLMDQAVRMRTEQIVMQSQQDNVETAGDFDLIQSFSAGSYSETRRDNMKNSQMINPWPALNNLLWLLLGLTPEEIAAGGNPAVDARRDYWLWLMTGVQPPAWATVEVDWAQGLGQAGDLRAIGWGYTGIYGPPVDFLSGE